MHDVCLRQYQDLLRGARTNDIGLNHKEKEFLSRNPKEGWTQNGIRWVSWRTGLTNDYSGHEVVTYSIRPALLGMHP